MRTCLNPWEICLLDLHLLEVGVGTHSRNMTPLRNAPSITVASLVGILRSLKYPSTALQDSEGFTFRIVSLFTPFLPLCHALRNSRLLSSFVASRFSSSSFSSVFPLVKYKLTQFKFIARGARVLEDNQLRDIENLKCAARSELCDDITTCVECSARQNRVKSMQIERRISPYFSSFVSTSSLSPSSTLSFRA